MQLYWVYGLGFLAQILFGFRMVVQWIQSERLKRVVAPRLFWQASLLASILFIVYGVLRDDPVIVLGQCLAYVIYARNLHLDGSWNTFAPGVRTVFTLAPLALLLIFFYSYNLPNPGSVNSTYPMYLLIGGAGQLLLNIRFIYQWWISERQKMSVLPPGFWIISLAGSLLILIYGAYRSDPVLLFSQTGGAFVYIRNLIIGYRAAWPVQDSDDYLSSTRRLP